MCDERLGRGDRVAHSSHFTKGGYSLEINRATHISTFTYLTLSDTRKRATVNHTVLSFSKSVAPQCPVDPRRCARTQTRSRWCIPVLIIWMFAVIMDFSHHLYRMIRLQSSLIGLNEYLMRAW